MAENVDIVVNIENRASEELDDINKKIRDTENASEAFNKAAEKAGNLGKSLTAIGLAGAGMIALFANAAGKMESTQVAMTTAFQGNEEAAKQAMVTIQEFSKATPFALDEVTSSFLKLKNLGLDPSMEALTSYGNTASSMGKSLNDMIEAVADASTGEFERLKEFGIRAKSEGENVSFTFQGITTTVKNNSEEIQNYLLDIGNTKFAGGMEAQSRTLLGIWSTLKDSIFQLSATLGATFADDLKFVADKLIALAEGVGKFVQENPAVAEFAGKVLLIGTALALVLGPLLMIISFLPTIIAGFTAVGAIFGVSGAIAAAAFLPIIGIIGLVIAAGYLLITHWDSIKASASSLVINITNFFSSLFESIKGIMENVSNFMISVWNGIKEAVDIIIKTLFTAITFTFSVALGGILTILEFFGVDWQLIWEGIKIMAEVIWNGI